RRDVIGGGSVPARNTGEASLRWTIGFIDAPTGDAGATGVLGIDQDHRHSRESCLVDDKASELEEGPVVQSCPLPAAGRYPVADARQVFEGDPASGALRRGHD